MAATQIVLVGPLSPEWAALVGLAPRDYLIGEQITVEQVAADRLQRAGYVAPVGTPATATFIGGIDPNAPAVIRASGSTYAVRSSVTSDPNRTVIWIGATAPTVGNGFAISGVDLWIQG